jgi:hypothetical protein
MGELADIGVADLLYLFGLRRQTGKLTINTEGDEISIFVEEGKPVVVSASNLSLRLGRMLLRLGMIDAGRLRMALQEQEVHGADRPLGRILLDRGWLTEADLARCIEEQCIHALAHVITAKQGIFIWSRGVAASRRLQTVPLNVDRILLEATRRTDELTTLGTMLPPANAPLLLRAEIESAINSLSAEEILVATALQAGASSLAELRDQLALDEVVVCRTVARMRKRGLIVAGRDPRPETGPLRPGTPHKTGTARLASPPPAATQAEKPQPEKPKTAPLRPRELAVPATSTPAASPQRGSGSPSTTP